ncbi:MAG: hypothetical protein R3229_04595 [Alphaproteobacteria bacterium]|nr:hypothetical protein [Alphaproteobacteria bacterium]
MTLEFACAVSHAPGTTAWTEAAPKETVERIHSGYRRLRDRLAAAEPDVVLAFTNEHWNNFFLDHMPAFCIGRGAHFAGPVEVWLKVEKAKVPGDPELAQALIDSCYAAGFDVSYSDELALDHGTMVPLHFLTPEMDVPVVPLFTNALVAPMPTPARCYALGAALGQALANSEKRVALVATGGLSHWPGEAEHGRIDRAFDDRFVSDMVEDRADRLRGYTHEDIARSGTGTHEVRNWILLRGAIPGWRGEVVTYEEVPAWATGYGLLAFDKAGA